jgi:hypothetical protein
MDLREIHDDLLATGLQTRVDSLEKRVTELLLRFLPVDPKPNGASLSSDRFDADPPLNLLETDS